MLVRKKTFDRLMKALNIMILSVFLLQPAGGPGLYFAFASSDENAEPIVTQEESDEPVEELDETEESEEEENTDETEESADNDDVDIEEDVEEEFNESEDPSDDSDTEQDIDEEELSEEDADKEGEEDDDTDENDEEDSTQSDTEQDLEDNITPTSDESSDKDVDEEKCSDDWEEKDGTYTRCVEEGIKYELDINKEDELDALQITFTSIDEGKNKDNDREITIKEVKLTDEQVAQLGALSGVAYDITSTMENGSFEYDLVLPISEKQDFNKEDLSVIYIEDAKDLKELEQDVVTDVVEDKDVKVDVDGDEITVENLDHFTLFIPMCQCGKIKICHRTSAHNNPYNKIEVSGSSIFRQGHDGHNGPIWFSGIDEAWGDIIPPFDYFGGRYDGKNWDTQGQKVWENNCSMPGSITIIKDAQPDDSQEFEFEGSIKRGAEKFTLVDDGSQTNNSKTFSSLPKNTYTIIENETEGWDLTDISCEGGKNIKKYVDKGKVRITLGEGENVVCTFTNDQEGANLTLIKKVINDNGGNTQVSDWVLSATGPTAISGVTGSVDVTDAVVSVGTYTLSEQGYNGYSASAWDCGDTKVSRSKIELENGDDVTCKITNKDIPSDLTVCKFNDVTGDGKYNDGDLLLGGWDMTLYDSMGNEIDRKTTQDMRSRCVTAPGCVTFRGLSAGNYTVTETQQTGWINTNATDLTQPVTLGLDNSQTIYFGNQELSTIIVHKDVVGPGGEDITDTTNNFTVTLDGTDEKTLTDGETFSYNGIVAGDEQKPNVYTIDESIIPVGYVLESITPDGDVNTPGAQVTVVPGETTEVVVVNRQQLYCGDGIVTGDEECDGDAGVGEGEFCTSQCKLVPVYDGKNECPEGTKKVHIDTITLDSHSGNVESLSFDSGSIYLLEASGTYQYAGGSQRKADAAYGTTDNFSTWRQDIGIWGTNRGVTSILGDLGRGMGVVEWDDDQNINTSHVYAKLVEPQGNLTADFVIGDWYSDWYGNNCDDQSCLGDNDGSLDVDLYECRANETIDGYKYDYVTNAPIENWPIELCRFEDDNVANACTGIATATTDSNGYYEFTNLPVGLYKVTEGTMTGYTQMAPTSYIVDLTGDTMQADGNMIANGGFEAPVVGGSWDHYAEGIAGLAWDVEWVGSTVMYDEYSRPEPARAEIQKSVGGWSDFEGNQYAELDTDWGVANGEPSNVSLSQEIQTCNGGEYELRYTWSPRPHVNNNQMDISWGTGTDSHSANGGSDTVWTSETQTFTANSNTINISFTENGPENSLGMFLDGVEVVQTNTCPRGSVDFYNRKDIPDVRHGSITACKFEDSDRDGQQDAGEEMISGWEMTLGNETKTTDENGCTTFDKLPLGKYTVTEEDRNGWEVTTGSLFQGVVLGAAVEDYHKTVTFGNYYELGKIRAIKYEDTNGNGTRDNGESRLNGWVMTLTDEQGNEAVGTTGDNGRGKVIFDNLAVGTYTICETMQDGWTSTEPDNNSLCYTKNVRAGKTTKVSFGNVQLDSIHGVKWHDRDMNGDRDSGEELLSGWTIFLDENADGILDPDEQSTITSSETGHDGEYLFEGLYPGEYRVCEVMQSGWEQTYPLNPNCHTVTLPEDNSACECDNDCWLDWGCDNWWNCDCECDCDCDCNEYDFGNVERGEVIVTKWHDVNGDGIKDEGEEVLEGWDMNLKMEGDTWYDETQTTLIDGTTTFVNLKPTGDSPYILSETLQDYWQQTGIYCEEEPVDDNDDVCEGDCLFDAVGWNFVPMEDMIRGELLEESISFDLAPGETKNCYVGNQFITPNLTVTKTNNEYANGPDKPGDIVKYTLTVHADATGGPILDAIVMDVPPKQFQYVSGSYSAVSNVNPTLNIPEPVYNSFGTWMLGDMVPGEVITLMYDAKIGDGAQTGMYPDVAFANGKDVMGMGITASSAPSDFIVAEGIVNGTFVGTQIEIEADEQEAVSVDVEVDEDVDTVKKKKDVYLPATGAEEGWIKLALVALLAGILFLVSGGVMRMRRKKVLQSIKTIAFLTVMSIVLAGAGSVSAVAGDVVVRADEPVEKSNTTFSFGYVVLDAQSRGVDVDCLVQKPSSTTFETFRTTTYSGIGSSGDCGISDDVLSEQGTYKFKVQASTGGDVSESEMYEVTYNTTAPGKPKWIEKDKEGDCRYDVEFKTADDGQTVRVELYHSRDREFNVNEDSKWATVIVGPNEKMTVTDHLDETSVCNKKHWYAVRAFDEAGNASDVRVEEEEIEETETVKNVIIVETTSSTTGTTTSGTGSSDGITDGETSADTESSGETGGEEGADTQIDEDGEVAGEATEEESVWGLTSGKWLGALLITLGVIGIVYAVVRARNDKASGKQNS